MKSYGTDKITRLLRILTLLGSGRSYSVDELAADMEVSRRTIFRDMNALEAAHVPYYYDEQSGGYRVTENFFLPAINFDLSEALSVMLLSCAGQNSQLVPGLEFSRMAAVKIESVLPDSLRSHIGGILKNFEFRDRPLASDGRDRQLLMTLAEAISARNVCKVVYQSVYDADTLTLEIHPLRLVFISRAWYLLAYSELHGQMRTFKLVRIEDLDVLEDKKFTPPPESEIDSHYSNAWSMIPEGKNYDIHLRFSPKVAHSVAEVNWHPSQKIYWREDGEIDFHVCVDGLGEISSWILGYGSLVRVIGPGELVKRVTNAARSLVDMYDSRKDTPASRRTGNDENKNIGVSGEADIAESKLRRS